MKTIITLIFLGVFTSCSGAKSQIASQTISKETYLIDEINGNKISSENLTLTFDLNENRVYGYSGCNNFNGSFIIEDNNITFGPIAATKKMCLDTSSENELFKILQGTKTFSVENNALELSDANNTLLKANIASANKMTQDKKITFDYNANSRGFYLSVNISNIDPVLTVSNVRGMKPAKQSYTDEEWNQLTRALETIQVDSLPDLEPPSKKFQFDGAAMATLTVYIDGNTYQTPIFDHGNPPKEIQELVNLLLSFTEKD